MNRSGLASRYRCDRRFRRPDVIRRVFETPISAPVERLWEFHRSAEALRLLAPPGKPVEPVGDDLEVRNGARHVLRIRMGPLRLTWVAVLSQVNPPFGFVDTAEKSPFAFWRHHHEFLPTESGSLLRDTVEYRLPFGLLGTIAHTLLVRRDIESMFAHRHRVTKEAVERAA